jgi:predicted NBD/HSP70 family sugar kinase
LSWTDSPCEAPMGSPVRSGISVVVADARRCGCGGRGCLETLAYARAVAGRYNWLWGSSEEVGAETVVERALTGDVGASGARDARGASGR